MFEALIVIVNMKQIARLVHDYYHEASWEKPDSHEFLWGLYLDQSGLAKSDLKKGVSELSHLNAGDLVRFINRNAVGGHTMPTEKEAQTWLKHLAKWCLSDN